MPKRDVKRCMTEKEEKVLHAAVRVARALEAARYLHVEHALQVNGCVSSNATEVLRARAAHAHAQAVRDEALADLIEAVRRMEAP